MVDKPQFTYIYGLKDERDGAIHYVGKSNRPKLRLQQHLEDESKNQAKVAWLQELVSLGTEPEIVILEKVIVDEWQEAERWWIADGRSQGWPLTNIRDGGEGGYREPDYSFFHSYLPTELHGVFEGLPFKYKKRALLDTAKQMAMCHYKALEQKAKMIDRQRINKLSWLIGRRKAADLVVLLSHSGE